MRFILRACADLFSHPDCQASMRTAADEAWPDALLDMQRRCADSYCPELPAPKPAMCATDGGSFENYLELYRAMLRYEKGDVVVIGEVISALEWPRRVVEPVLPETPPSTLPIPLVELRKASHGFTARLEMPDGGVRQWTLTADDVSPLREVLDAECNPQLLVRAQKQLMFLDLRAVLAAAADGGCKRSIDFATTP